MKKTMEDLETLIKAATLSKYKFTLTEKGIFLNGKSEPWNPLISDGDAQQLAIDLQMRLSFEHDCVGYYIKWEGLCIPGSWTYGDRDRREVVREAITRGAAMLHDDVVRYYGNIEAYMV